MLSIQEVKLIDRRFRSFLRRLKWDTSLRMTPFYRQFQPRIPPSHIDTRILLIPDQNYMYFRIPKAANTTVISTLMVNQGFDIKEIGWDSANGFKRNAGTRASIFFHDDIDAMLDGLFKFTVVRDPYARIVSAYRDKIENRHGIEREKVALYLGQPIEKEVKFDHFLDYLEKGKGLREDAHWARQVDLIPIGIDRLDYVGKVETLDRDLLSIAGKVFKEPQPMTTLAPHATGATTISSSLVDVERKRIRKLYLDDFEAFGY